MLNIALATRNFKYMLLEYGEHWLQRHGEFRTKKAVRAYMKAHRFKGAVVLYKVPSGTNMWADLPR